MASNQGHYVGSLPNDYAILSKFTHDGHEIEDSHRNHTAGELDQGHTDVEVDRMVHVGAPRRRSSFPSSYIRPASPTIPSMNFQPSGLSDRHFSIDNLNGVTENSPLLAPLVPRIAEEQPGDEDDTKSNTIMFWEEMRILSKYTLPVFGSVPLRCTVYLRANVGGVEHIYLNIV